MTDEKLSFKDAQHIVDESEAIRRMDSQADNLRAQSRLRKQRFKMWAAYRGYLGVMPWARRRVAKGVGVVRRESWRDTAMGPPSKNRTKIAPQIPSLFPKGEQALEVAGGNGRANGESNGHCLGIRAEH